MRMDKLALGNESNGAPQRTWPHDTRFLPHGEPFSRFVGSML